ncbi:hypothetical protein GOODEAATRI_027916 [Goodea atripinnis]|uniref:Uncharacterized protein n=1 Tax=Goodea atripinnis TaxID=208336 RepID=A0ABV0MLD2_9TELE
MCANVSLALFQKNLLCTVGRKVYQYKNDEKTTGFLSKQTRGTFYSEHISEYIFVIQNPKESQIPDTSQGINIQKSHHCCVCETLDKSDVPFSFTDMFWHTEL